MPKGKPLLWDGCVLLKVVRSRYSLEEALHCSLQLTMHRGSSASCTHLAVAAPACNGGTLSACSSILLSSGFVVVALLMLLPQSIRNPPSALHAGGSRNTLPILSRHHSPGSSSQILYLHGN